MNGPTNRKKIYIVLILCIGVVISTWLLQRKQSELKTVGQNNNVLDVNSYKNLNPNDDWKKILVNAQGENQIFTNLTANNSSEPEETTLTGQLARDVFSRYLLAAKNGQPLTPEETSRIVEQVLSSPEYTKSGGAVYIKSNLKINAKSDVDTVKKYNETLHQKLLSREIKNTLSPLVIIEVATKTEDEKELLKLGPFITNIKGIMSDLIEIEVPSDATEVHLGLLNSYSNLLFNLEAIEQMFSDPVKGLVGIINYGKYAEELQTAITNINIYFEKKIGPLE